MRDLLFRGKRKDNGAWIEGHYGEYMLMSGASIPCISIPNKEAVCGSICYDVEVSTVGQYTDLKDKNGKRVFEGDVVAVPKSSFVKSPPYLSNGTIKGVIEFGRYKQSCCDKEETNLGYYIKWFSDNEAVRNMLRKDTMFWFSEHFNEIKVIGNIHDNPELLEVE